MRSLPGAALLIAVTLALLSSAHPVGAQTTAPWGGSTVGAPVVAPVVIPATAVLQPFPGSVPLHFESDGDPLAVSVPVSSPDPRGDARPYEAAGFGDPSMPRVRVCQTPCTLFVPRGRLAVVVGGDGRRESNDAILVLGNEQWLRYRSASRAAFAFGHVLVWAGGGALVGGALTMLSSLAQHGPHDVTASALALLFGAVATAVGIPTLYFNRVGRIPARAGVRMNVSVAVPHDGGAMGAVLGAF
jgi:hypothetical protein